MTVIKEFEGKKLKTHFWIGDYSEEGCFDSSEDITDEISKKALEVGEISGEAYLEEKDGSTGDGVGFEYQWDKETETWNLVIEDWRDDINNGEGGLNLVRIYKDLRELVDDYDESVDDYFYYLDVADNDDKREFYQKWYKEHGCSAETANDVWIEMHDIY